MPPRSRGASSVQKVLQDELMSRLTQLPPAALILPLPLPLRLFRSHFWFLGLPCIQLSSPRGGRGCPASPPGPALAPPRASSPSSHHGSCGPFPPQASSSTSLGGDRGLPCPALPTGPSCYSPMYATWSDTMYLLWFTRA